MNFRSDNEVGAQAFSDLAAVGQSQGLCRIGACERYGGRQAAGAQPAQRDHRWKHGGGMVIACQDIEHARSEGIARREISGIGETAQRVRRVELPTWTPLFEPLPPFGPALVLLFARP